MNYGGLPLHFDFECVSNDSDEKITPCREAQTDFKKVNEMNYSIQQQQSSLAAVVSPSSTTTMPSSDRQKIATWRSAIN